MEIRATVTNLFEIKTIAGFVSYKTCRLSFNSNCPLDSISHFRKHVDIFKNKSEPKELEFEHKLWLSKQFSMFGTLFEVAVGSGLIPSQTQHPGYYFYEAALNMIARRKLASSTSSFDTTYAEFYHKLVSSSNDMEYIGQRPWRPGCQSKYSN